MFPSVAKRQFALSSTEFCFVGHTHVPIVFTYYKGEIGPEVMRSVESAD